MLYLTPFSNSTFSIGMDSPETGGSFSMKFIFINSVFLFISPPPKMPKSFVEKIESSFDSI